MTSEPLWLVVGDKLIKSTRRQGSTPPLPGLTCGIYVNSPAIAEQEGAILGADAADGNMSLQYAIFIYVYIYILSVNELADLSYEAYY